MEILKYIINSTKIINSTTYQINKEIYNIAPKMEEGISTNNVDILLKSMAEQLYQFYHCRLDSDLKQKLRMQYNNNYYNDRFLKSFHSALSLANKGGGYWDPEWEIKNIKSNGYIEVYKEGYIILSVTIEKFKSYNDDIKIGQKGHVFMPKEWRQLLSGFYTAHGNTTKIENNSNLLRLYWNINIHGAILLIEEVTEKLNHLAIPFMIKVINNPKNFGRTDSAVLYLSKDHLFQIDSTLKHIYTAVKLFLNTPTSCFAKKITDGIAYAEDPNNGKSFGEFWSELLSQGIFICYKENITDLELCQNVITKYLESNGINVNYPYLFQLDGAHLYDQFFKRVFSRQ